MDARRDRELSESSAFIVGAVVGLVIGAAAVLMHMGAWKLFAELLK